MADVVRQREERRSAEVSATEGLPKSILIGVDQVRWWV